MKILLIDNYDSFTYNLVHLIESIIDTDVVVKRNDEIALEAISNYDKIILSPGPGVPKDAGSLIPIIQQYYTTKPILGVCLGHQAIGEALGASLINLKQVYHGVATDASITNEDAILFKGLSNNITIGRYHSWVIDKDTLPTELEITAIDEEGNVMGMQHKIYPVHSVQFHPESILTPNGAVIMKNFLDQ